MNTPRRPAPGFHRHPNHRITIERAAGRWQVMADTELLADSESAVELLESGYETAVYFPARDVRLDRLLPSASETTCPFKGRAQYFRLAVNPASGDIAWTYPATYSEVAAIEGHIAFYADRVELKNISTHSSKENTRAKNSG